ncbi:O-methylsterigmatocystin oxidoreductase [Penicillium rolfsii]|nr:O-methylsterigmatocystin oxidoreductase [Penicillium rolfsii]
MSSFALISAILGAALVYIVTAALTRKKSPTPLPPGPPGKPLVGNVWDLPPAGAQDWMHWLEYKERYGPISSITVLGQTIVIVNNQRVATRLLTKQAHSSRPNLVFASQMVGWEHILAMQPYSDRFHAYRRVMKPYLGSETAVSQYDSLQEVEVHRFLLRVLQDPTKLSQYIQTEAGAVILNIAYGYNIEPHKRDPLVDIANLALEHFAIAGTPGAWLVDMVPILTHIPRWFPGASFKRTAQDWKKNLEKVMDVPYAFVKKRVESGKFQPSYLANLFKASGYPPIGSEEELVAKWSAGSLYTGGADTTVCSIETFFLAMTLYPDVQRKAQEEIDRALGGLHRLPTVADRKDLPYINAVVKEVFRWHPVAPMGIPHMSIEADKYEGYHIPKGSLIMPNIWAMTHDPEVYHNPMAFEPERFLYFDGKEPEMDPCTIIFGFGRRVCPGRILADITVYLTVARSLAVFNATKAIENGKVVEVKPEFRAGVISHPVPWKFNITSRSQQHEALILSVENLYPWKQSDAPDLKDI